MSKITSYNDRIIDIDTTVGGDWNHPRARMYIAAVLEEKDKTIHHLDMQLEMEKAVMARLEELLKSWFKLRIDNESH